MPDSRKEPRGWRDRLQTQPVECRRCGEVKIVPRVGSVGDTIAVNGYSAVLRSDTSILWFCPGCVTVLLSHIQAIVDATGGEHVHWPHMINLLKDSKDREGT